MCRVVSACVLCPSVYVTVCVSTYVRECVVKINGGVLTSRQSAKHSDYVSISFFDLFLSPMSVAIITWSSNPQLV